MQYPRTEATREYGLRGEDEYSTAYTANNKHAKASRRATYPPTQAPRSSKFRDNDFSSSGRTLVDIYDHPLEPRPYISGSIIERQDSALHAKPPHKTRRNGRDRTPTQQGGFTSTDFPPKEATPSNVHRNKENTKAKPSVFIETLTVPSNGPPLETHFRNTEGNVHIKHLKIENSTVSSPRSAPHRRRRIRQKPAEKEGESVSKLTRVCELATLAALVLRWKEYKSNK